MPRWLDVRWATWVWIFCYFFTLIQLIILICDIFYNVDWWINFSKLKLCWKTSLKSEPKFQFNKSAFFQSETFEEKNMSKFLGFIMFWKDQSISWPMSIRRKHRQYCKKIPSIYGQPDMTMEHFGTLTRISALRKNLGKK